jgi:hypothetical protein
MRDLASGGDVFRVNLLHTDAVAEPHRDFAADVLTNDLTDPVLGVLDGGADVNPFAAEPAFLVRVEPEVMGGDFSQRGHFPLASFRV